MIREAISTLISGESLGMEEAASVMEEIMQGEATPAQLAAFVTALRIKGETADEIAGLAQVMRAKAIRVNASEPLLDIVGTGGDNANTFNISTAAALVAAGCGLKVAKHGNRAMSSQCGSADVLEALGVKIDLNAAQVEKCLETVGIGFMFAPAFHPAMKYAAGPRRELGIRTVFNILGPLTNPAGATYQVLGVADESLLEKIAAVLQRLGCRHVLVVHGEGGIDEMTITGKSYICELRDNSINSYTVNPEDFGLSRATRESLQGGTASENAELLLQTLSGNPGPKRDAVVLNAAAGLIASDHAADFKEGIALAGKAIDKGYAREKLDRLIKLSQSLGNGGNNDS